GGECDASYVFLTSKTGVNGNDKGIFIESVDASDRFIQVLGMNRPGKTAVHGTERRVILKIVSYQRTQTVAGRTVCTNTDNDQGLFFSVVFSDQRFQICLKILKGVGLCRPIVEYFIGSYHRDGSSGF